MKKNSLTDQNQTSPSSSPNQSGGLHLVGRDTPEEKLPQAKKKRQSPLIGFMTAYADALDQEVKSILEL